MNLLARFTLPKALTIPFVPLGISLDAGLAILSQTGTEVVEEREKEHSFTVQLAEAALAIYTDGQRVKSVWYDDPLGRGSARGKKRKIELHLARYGALPQWSLWNENQWMKYWKNDAASVQMVYGIHMDVLRFNLNE